MPSAYSGQSILNTAKALWERNKGNFTPPTKAENVASGNSGRTVANLGGILADVVKATGGKPIDRAETVTPVSRSIAHLLQGIASITVANSARPEDPESGVIMVKVPEVVRDVTGTRDTHYRPAIIDSALSVIDVAKLAYDKTFNKPTTASLAKEEARSYPSLENLAAADARTREWTGARTPQNIAERGLETLGGLIGAAPRSVTKGVARAANWASDFVHATTGSSKLATAARVGTRVVGEAAIPLRQHTLLPTAAVVLPVSEVVNNALVEEPALSVIDDKDAEGLQIEPNLPLDLGPEELQKLTPEQYQHWATAREIQVEQDAIETEEDENVSRKYIAAGIIGAGALGAAFLYNKGLLRPKTAMNASPTLAGVGKEGSFQTLPQQAASKMFDQSKPMVDALRKYVSEDAAIRAENNLALSHNTSTSSQAQYLLLTGRAPIIPEAPAAVALAKYNKVAPMLDSYAKELSRDQQQLVTSAALAASELDDRIRTGVNGSFKDLTTQQLNDIVSIVKNDPVTNKYLAALQQAYRDDLDLQHKGGLISQAQMQTMVTKRPNYVPIKRQQVSAVDSNVENPYSANKPEWYARTDDAGIPMGEAANPFALISARIATTIQHINHNSIRESTLSQLAAADGKLVRVLKEAPSDANGKGIHTTFVDGVPKYYEVNDAGLSRALEFAPRATAGMFGKLREFAQNTMTGPISAVPGVGNMFGFIKAPFYQTTSAHLLKPPEVALGLVNELASKISDGKISLGRADVTSYLTAYTGMMRNFASQLTEQFVLSAESAMFRNKDYLGISPEVLKPIADYAGRLYERGTMAMLKRTGGYSSHLYGTPDATNPIVGLERVSPQFSSAIARDIYDSVNSGDFSLLEKAFVGSKTQFEIASNYSPVSLYTRLLEAAHNGMQHSIAAGNKTRVKDLSELASVSRRLVVDNANYGASKLVNLLNDVFIYANIAMQTIYETARMIKQNGAGAFLGNLVGFAAPLVGAHMWAMYDDPEALERHNAKSLDQKATTITLSHMVEVPIDPLFALFINPVLSMVHHITGMEAGVKPTLEHSQAMLQLMLDGDEAANPIYKAAGESIGRGLENNFPYMPANFSPIRPALPALGINPGSTRGGLNEARPTNVQDIYGERQKAQNPNDLFSATTTDTIYSIFGTSGANVLTLVNEGLKARGQGAEADHIIKQVGSFLTDNIVKNAGIFTAPASTLFGNRTLPGSINDTNFQLYNENYQTIEKIKTFGTRELSHPGYTSSQPSEYGILADDRVIKQEYVGTPIETIFAFTKEMTNSKEYRALTKQLKDLGEVAQSVRGQTLSTAEERNVQLKDINAKRRETVANLLQLQRFYEAAIGERIGDPHFSYGAYEIDAVTKD